MCQQYAAAQIQVCDNNTRQHRFTKKKPYESTAAQWFGMDKRTGSTFKWVCTLFIRLMRAARGDFLYRSVLQQGATSALELEIWVGNDTLASAIFHSDN